MKEEPTKHPLNAPGKYYVDCDTCLDHDLCVETAPNNFKLNSDHWGVYVFKQPSNPEEEAQCRQAMLECPVEAIQDDG